MADYTGGDEFLYDALNDSLPLKFLQEHDVQSSFLNANVDDIEMLSETTSLSFSDSGFANLEADLSGMMNSFRQYQKKDINVGNVVGLEWQPNIHYLT